MYLYIEAKNNCRFCLRVSIRVFRSQSFLSLIKFQMNFNSQTFYQLLFCSP